MGYTSKICFKWGLWSSQNPTISIVLGLTICLVASCGFINFSVSVSQKMVIKHSDRSA